MDNMCGLTLGMKCFCLEMELSHKASAEIRAEKSMRTWGTNNQGSGVNLEGNSRWRLLAPKSSPRWAPGCTHSDLLGGQKGWEKFQGQCRESIGMKFSSSLVSPDEVMV